MISRWIDADAFMQDINNSIAVMTEVGIMVDGEYLWSKMNDAFDSVPSIDLVRCRECKHRPIKDDPNGENYGINLIEPKDRNKKCPCLIEDGWYS